MSTVSGGQGNIVTTGLVLNLDAANPRSYAPPFNGTTWQNIAPVSSSLTGSLVGGVAYTGSNSGALVFDGINDYVNLGNTPATQFPNTSPWSFSITTELLSQNTLYPGILVKGNHSSTGLLVFYYSSGSIVLKHNNQQPNAFVVSMNRPFMYTVTYAGSGTAKVYLNGLYRAEGPPMAGVDTTSNLLLGVGDSYSNIRVYNFTKYNRELNPSEVLQNFNATRARFGI